VKDYQINGARLGCFCNPVTHNLSVPSVNHAPPRAELARMDNDHHAGSDGAVK